MKRHGFALAAAVTMAAASTLAAQEHAHPATTGQKPDMVAMHCGGSMGKMMPGMRGGGPMMRGMMHMMGAATPGMILQHRQQLSLSADQVSQLEAMQKQAQAACTKHMELAMATHNAANQMLEASSPDFAAYSAKMKEAAVHMAEGQVTMAKAAVEARNILTTGQRQTLQTLAEQKHKRP